MEKVIGRVYEGLEDKINTLSVHWIIIFQEKELQKPDHEASLVKLYWILNIMTYPCLHSDKKIRFSSKISTKLGIQR